jgi:HAMP domain-containing protein
VVHHFQHLSVRSRLAFGTLVPLGLAAASQVLAWSSVHETAAPGNGLALLSGALLFAAISSGLMLLQINIRTVVRPLERAHLATQALVQGNYGVRVRVDRLDEVGRLLVALEELGDYLAVVLPEDEDTAPRGGRLQSVPTDSLERIAAQLCEGGEAFSAGADALVNQPSPARSTARLRLVDRQA